jgi:hypothetical protein
MNKLEILQNETSGFNYIKSYPILKKLFKAQLNISIIELVLSYTSNGLEFYMNYKKMAEILSSKEQSIRNTIKLLSQQGYLITDNVKKYNNKSGVGGSSTKIVVDLDKIITDIDNPITKAVKKEQPKATKPKSNTIPTKEVKTIATDKNNISVSKLVKAFRAIQISPNDKFLLDETIISVLNNNFNIGADVIYMLKYEIEYNKKYNIDGLKELIESIKNELV